MNRPAMQQLTVIGLMLTLAAAASGCGGGAMAKTTVRYRPANPDAVSGDAAVAATTDAAATPGDAAASGIGSFTGTVVVQGDVSSPPPKYAKGAAPKDTDVCGIEQIPDESVVVKDGKLANVFIYLAKAPKNAPTVSTDPIIFDQKSCIFKPHVLIVQTKQVVKILNSDGVLHNTHTYPSRNSSFNQGVKPNDTVGVDLLYTRAESEPFQVGCDVHPWMIAFHLPVDHPYAAVSDADGKFEIKDLPAGKHEFKVWHEKGGLLQKSLSVIIKPNEPTEMEIPVPASKLAP